MSEAVKLHEMVIKGLNRCGIIPESETWGFSVKSLGGEEKLAIETEERLVSKKECQIIALS